MEASFIQILVQGGLAGVALAALYVIYRMQNGQRIEFMAELKANREANAQQAQLTSESLGRVAEGQHKTAAALDRMTERLDKIPVERRGRRRINRK